MSRQVVLKFQIQLDVTNASVDSSVAIDDLDVRVGSRVCNENNPPCSVYTLDKAFGNPHPDDKGT